MLVEGKWAKHREKEANYRKKNEYIKWGEFLIQMAYKRSY